MLRLYQLLLPVLLAGAALCAPERRNAADDEEKVILDPKMPPDHDQPALPVPNMKRGNKDKILQRGHDMELEQIRNILEHEREVKSRNFVPAKPFLPPEVLKRNLAEDGRPVTTTEEAKAFEIKGRTRMTSMTGKAEQHAVDLHRAYRAKEHASNIWHMKWSSDLADLAQGLADTCVFKHTNLAFSNGTHVGQNLGAVKGPDRSLDYIMKLFYDEKKFYNFQDHEWGDNTVGHYLQMVFWESASVGCGAKFCEELFVVPTNEKWINATYYVCDYWPPAGWKERPYKDGDRCSKCIVPKNSDMGWKCEVDGCAECNLKTDVGCHPAPECTEFKPDLTNCAFMEQMGACEPGHTYHKAAQYYCQTTCKVCNDVPDFLKGR